MSITQVRCQLSSQHHLALDTHSTGLQTGLCWRKGNEGGHGIYKHLPVQRMVVNLQQALPPRGCSGVERKSVRVSAVGERRHANATFSHL